MSTGFALKLSMEELMQKARDVSGIDLVDRDAVEPLAILYESLNGESRLHELGALEQQRKLLRLLVNRLRMQRDIKAHPEIVEQKIGKPIFIFGMPRTGSTKMQELLAASGDFNWLPFWQSFNPSSVTGTLDESHARRIQEAVEYSRWFDEASPETKKGHAFDALLPNEETWILEHSLQTLVFQAWSSVWSYLDWLLQKTDMTAQFSFLRDALKYLQWQGLHDESKPWVLKCPCYVGLEEALFSVFPGSFLIMTHRSPLQTAPSVCKMASAFFKPHTNKMPDPDKLVDGFALQMQAHLDFRRRHPDIRFLDIRYDDLLQHEEEVLERIYASWGSPLSETSKQNIVNWSRKNPKHKHGAFVYSLEQFGLSESKINAQFEGYNRFLAKI